MTSDMMLNLKGPQGLEAWLMRELAHARDIKLMLHETWSDYYGQSISDEQLIMMADDLADYPLVDLQRAMVRWRRMPPEKGHKPRAPMPAELIALMRPQNNDDEQANLIAGQIIQGIGKYGYNRPQLAKDSLGPVAWEAVQGRGGWFAFCKSTEERTIAQTHAQLRDLVRAILRRRGPELSISERQLANKPTKRLPEEKIQRELIEKTAKAMSL